MYSCQKGYLERYDLEDPSQCAQLEQNVAHCEGWRRPACAPEWQAECDAAVRRVAPLDAWLHRTATRRFRAAQRAIGRCDAIDTESHNRIRMAQRGRCCAIGLFGQILH